MIYLLLTAILAVQCGMCAILLKKRKERHIPAVNYSIEDPTIYHIVLWSIGDIWINYETLTCFMLVTKGFKRSWKVISKTSLKYTINQKEVLQDPKLVKQHEEDLASMKTKIFNPGSR